MFLGDSFYVLTAKPSFFPGNNFPFSLGDPVSVLFQYSDCTPRLFTCPFPGNGRTVMSVLLGREWTFLVDDQDRGSNSNIHLVQYNIRPSPLQQPRALDAQ